MSVEFAIENLEGLPPELDGSFSGEGVMSLADGTSQFTMGLPVPGAEPVEMEMRVVGTQMYMRSPLFTEGTGFETEWLGLDMSELTGLNESELLGSGMADADLGSELQYLRGASEQIENLGREEVRGVPTTHYWVLIDERRALEEIPEHGREAFEKMLDAYEEEFGTTEYPMDVWIDDDGLPRRIVTVESLASDPTLPPGTTLTATMEFHDFGVPVDVQEPPEGDVLDLTDMLRQGFGLD